MFFKIKNMIKRIIICDKCNKEFKSEYKFYDERGIVDMSGKVTCGKCRGEIKTEEGREFGTSNFNK